MWFTVFEALFPLNESPQGCFTEEFVMDSRKATVCAEDVFNFTALFLFLAGSIAAIL